MRSRLDVHQAVALRQPAGTDAVLGWTRSRSLVLWRYSAAAAHRAFATGTEGCAAMPCASVRPAQPSHRTASRFMCSTCFARPAVPTLQQVGMALRHSADCVTDERCVQGGVQGRG